MIYHSTSRLDKAIADYTSAIAVKADFAEAYGNRAKAYADLGDWDSALADLRKVVEINPAFKERITPLVEKVEELKARQR